MNAQEANLERALGQQSDAAGKPMGFLSTPARGIPRDGASHSLWEKEEKRKKRNIIERNGRVTCGVSLPGLVAAH